MPDSPSQDTQALRRSLGRFATGVTIVTCIDGAVKDGEARVGLTANSFASLSLAPPLVLWSLRAKSASLAAFEGAEHFAINVLSEAQVELSRHFAGALTPAEKFAEGQWAQGQGGVPVLAGTAAVFECRTVSRQVQGDHVLFVGEVLAHSEAPVPPLVFQSGHYRLLGEVL
ncbi:MAG: flavin reductase family protein [Rubrivivax sp.]|jgi:3-hydroxy-9,10-secoandrosta-1,3,5(10)-triene-9,17-dione monooxygenase reductase component|nr:flavin reductase family protein [Rubrivivax sp.]